MTRRTVGLLLMVAVLTLGGGCSSTGEPLTGRVERVIDGDTIVVRGVGVVRYLGIDTPELHHPRRPVERLARAALRANTRLVAGREVRLEIDREPRDAHGRVLAYVYADGVFVNAALVRQGMARTLAITPNTRHAGELGRLRDLAERDRLGLWGPAAGGPPWGSPLPLDDP